MRVVVVGKGKALPHVCRSLIAKNMEPIVVCSDREQANAMAKMLGINVLVGSGADPNIYDAAGVDQADLVIALAPDDTENMVICQLAKKLYGAKRCIALVNDPDSEAVFSSLGADLTISIAAILSDQLAVQVDRIGVIRQVSLADGCLVAVEITLPVQAPAVGQSPQQLAAKVPNVVAVRRGQVLTVEQSLEPGDQLVVTVAANSLAKTITLLLGRES